MESVLEGVVVVLVFDRFVVFGCNMIFVIVFGYMDVVLVIVVKYLIVCFEYFVGFKIM